MKIKIGAISLLVAVIAIIVTIFQPDIREFAFSIFDSDSQTDSIPNKTTSTTNREKQNITNSNEKKKNTKNVTNIKTKPNLIAVNRTNNPVITETAIVIAGESAIVTSPISNIVASIYSNKENNIGVSNLLNSRFKTNYFDLIYSGNSSELLELQLHEHVDYLFLAKVKLSEKINDKGLTLIRIVLEATIYDTENFNLKKQFNVTSKGLNFDSNLSKEQAINNLREELINNI